MNSINRIILLVGTEVPTFNLEEAKNLSGSWLTPLINFGLWAIPTLAVLASLAVGAKFFFEDEEQKERKPLWKRLRPIIVGAIVLTSIQAILKVFGIA